MSEFTQAIEEVRRKREEAVEECLLLVEVDAKLNCPVRTGTLKRSITHDVRSEDTKTKGAVGSNVEYAYWAERNQPYLEPAVDQNMEHIKIKIKEALQS